MESNWFVFKGDHHLGPFSKDEIVHLFALGKLADRDMVWKEGGDDWIPIRNHSEFREVLFSATADLEPENVADPLESVANDYESESDHSQTIKSEIKDDVVVFKETINTDQSELPPNLPPLPFEEEDEEDDFSEWDEFNEPEPVLKSPQDLEKTNVDNFEDDYLEEVQEVPSPVVDEEEIFDLKKDHDYEKEHDHTSEVQVEVEKPPRFKSPTKPLHLYVLAFITFIGLIFSLTFIFNQPKIEQKISGVSLEVQEKMEKIISESTKKHLLEVSRDESEFWLAYGDDFNGNANLYLQSLEGKVLSRSVIEVFGSTQIIGGVARFNNLEILRGSNLTYGEYKYVLTLRRNTPLSKFARFLSAKGIDSQWLIDLISPTKLRGRIGIFGKSKKSFLEKLSMYKGKLHEKETTPLKDQIEKLESLKTLLQKTREIFEQRMSVAVTWRAFKKFETRFAMEVSPIMQKIVLDSNEIAMKLMDSRILVSNAYTEVFELGRGLGEFATVMIDRTKSVQRYNPKIKKDITDEFMEEFNRLFQEYEEAISVRKAKLEKLNQELSG